MSSSLAKAGLKAVVLDSMLNKGVLSLSAMAEPVGLVVQRRVAGFWPLCFCDEESGESGLC